MCGCSLWIAAIRLHLYAVDEIRELDGVLDKEYRDVVSDKIPITLISIEFDGETADIAGRIDRSGSSRNG